MSISKFILTGLLLLASHHLALAQIQAITENGDTVLLMPDNTWDFIENFSDDKLIQQTALDTSDIIYSKPQSSTSVDKNLEGKYEAWYNDKEWIKTDPKLLNPAADMAFRLQQGDGYGMIIFEGLEIPLASLKDIAVQNAKRASKNVKILEEEYRTVNGQNVLYLKMRATVSGLDLAYIYYFHSSPQGTLQYITFTGENMLPEHEEALVDLLNGLVIK